MLVECYVLILLVWLSSLRKGMRNLLSLAFFILIRKGNDKRTSYVRCFYDSRMKLTRRSIIKRQVCGFLRFVRLSTC